MSFADWVEPSLNRNTVLRGVGALALIDPSSLSATPWTTRIVAVAWTLAATGWKVGVWVAAAATAAASRTMSITANAFAP